LTEEFRVERVSSDRLHDLRRRFLRNDDAALYHLMLATTK